jgi:glycosidase
VTQVQLNSLDSHDTARLLSIARGDKDTVKLGTLLQMTYPGAPCVYYGDEIAIRGSANTEERFHDREARWTFPWQDENQWDKEMLAYFREVIALRHAHPALRRGSYHELYAQGEVYAFARKLADEVVVTAVNVSTQPQTIAMPVNELLVYGAVLQPIFGEKDEVLVGDGRLQLTLPARSGVVLK